LIPSTKSLLTLALPKKHFHLPLERIPHYPSFSSKPDNFSYLPEKWFPDAEYLACWNRPAVDITDRLVPSEPKEARQLHNPPTFIRPELQFHGITRRLVLDPSKTLDLAAFERGTIISFGDSKQVYGRILSTCGGRDG
jgi:hypothetical protein